jgi:hypothetical protein
MRNVAGYNLQVAGYRLPVIPDTQTAFIPACPESSLRKDSRQAGVTSNAGLLLLCFCAFALLLFSTVALSDAFNLPDTGQTKCYRGVSPYDEISCAGTGQDGDYNINPMSFTDNGNGTVTDNNTDLIWQKQDDDTYYNWYQATGTVNSSYNPSGGSYKNVCGSLSLGGQSDWRVPTKKELITIVDYAIPYPGPTISTVYFPNTKSSNYWSSTTVAGYPVNAWYVYFNDGLVGTYYKHNDGMYVRCVRGGQ